MTDTALRASGIVAGRAGASMNYKRMYPVKVVTKDPDYYVGRIMVLSFAVFGFIDLIMEGALWLK